jgi:hypothetical protein
MGAKLQDIIGNRYGRLTVIEHLGVRGRRVHYWKCQCDCGKNVESSGDNLKEGNCKSCGCISKECDWNKTHSMSNTSEYKIWNSMKMRCINSNSESYSYYGGRGIKVCDRWINSFENFYEDMGKRPEGMSIDRIDVNGDYCPENCRWATMEEQSRNKRDNIHIEYKGQTKILTDWAKEINISVQTLYARLTKYGYSVEEALNLKLNHNKGQNFSGDKNPMSKLTVNEVKQIKKLVLGGEKIVSLAKQFNVSNSVISNIKNGHRWKTVEV